MSDKYTSGVLLLTDQQMQEAYASSPEFKAIMDKILTVPAHCKNCKATGVVKQSILMEVMQSGKDFAILCGDCMNTKSTGVRKVVYSKETLDRLKEMLDVYSGDDKDGHVKASLKLMRDQWDGFADDVPDDHPIIVAHMDDFREFLSERYSEEEILKIMEPIQNLTPKEQFTMLQDTMKKERKWEK